MAENMRAHRLMGQHGYAPEWTTLAEGTGGHTHPPTAACGDMRGSGLARQSGVPARGSVLL